jgi:competence protein ComEC
VGFQLSAAATAGLIVTAPPLERRLAGDRPARWRRWLAPALAVPIAASLWTLPLQLLHFGSAPLYAVPANLLVTPLLAPLTLAAMGLALASLLLPPLLPLLAPPVLLAAGALRHLVDRLAALPGAQLHPGRPGVAVALLLTLALLPWLAAAARRWRLASLPLLLVALLVHGGRVWGDQLLLVHHPGSTWLLARHHGRAALVARSGGARSCAGALRLARGLGHARLDWILLLDPVASEASDCWRRLSPVVLTAAGGAAALQPGQRVASPGLALAPLSQLSRAAELRVGGSRWLLLPDAQALWTLRSGAVALPGPARLDGVWLGRTPAGADLSWLLARRPRHVWISRPAPTAPGGGALAWTGRIGSLAARL